ncbi:MAG: S53 family peptidase [Frankiaceae bacterium]|nr:S53 family peptidase [Frankiaceae bacterium]MBV9369479.1 S53 family peptidase [Frankiales bacterium]
MSLLRRAAVAVATLAAVVLSGAALVPVAAAEPTASVVVALRVADPAALEALVHARGLSPAARHARLIALAPGRGRHDDVTRQAAMLGLQVTRSDAWTETVSGPVSAVRAAFGSVSDPVRPPALATSAVAVLPSSGHVAFPLSVHKPSGATTGADLRNAYSAPSGSTLGQGLTVATVQLSGWNSADLATYGNTLSPPVTPNYTPLSVNGAKPNQADGAQGDVEVALDQETLLAVAPSAAQRAYFAPNDDGGTGFIKAVQAVASDASAQHIAALSISWGACEAAAGPDFMAAMDQALALAVGAGVTVFAASGDEGSRDCIDTLGSPAASVDYPASSPYVVGVGGTTLPKTGTPAAWSGSGGGESSRTALPSWQQSVKAKSPHGRRLVPDISSDGAPADGIAVLDSVPSDQTQWWNVIGGTSFSAPTQAALLADTLGSAGWTSGGIGDIHPALYAAAASSGSGAFTDITSGTNGAYSAGPGFDLVTGLGTPLWSAIVSWLGGFTLTAPPGTRSTTVPLTATLPTGLPAAYRGWSAPAVDAADPQALCSTATASSSPTSVDLGSASPDGSYTVSVAGIDGSSANGGAGECHVAQTTVVLDRTAPKAAASVRPASASTALASWSSTDASPSSGAPTYAVTITDSGGTLYAATTAATSLTFDATGYRSYHVNVVAIDPAGNHSTTATAHLYDDLSMSFDSGWRPVASSGYFRSSRHVTTVPNAGASMAGSGTAFVVYVTTCPTCGRLAAYSGNTLLRVVGLTTNRLHTLVPVTLLTSTTPVTRTITLRAAHASATATSVQVDAAVIR